MSHPSDVLSDSENKNVNSDVTTKISSFSNGALVLSEGTPVWLEEMLANSGTSLEEGLMCALAVLAYEVGFRLAGDEEGVNPELGFDVRVMRKMRRSTGSAESGGAYRLYLCLGGSDERGGSILAVPAGGGLLLANLCPPPGLCPIPYSKALRPTDYVALGRSTGGRAELLPAAHGDLAVEFKAALVRLRQSIVLARTGLPHSLSLVGLPHEILLGIAQFLDPIAFTNLGSTCSRFFYQLYEDEAFWSSCCRRLFGPSNSSSDDWKEFVLFQVRTERRPPPPCKEYEKLIKRQQFRR